MRTGRMKRGFCLWPTLCILVLALGHQPVLAYDFSTPESALASLQEALRQRDASRIGNATYAAGWDQVPESVRDEQLEQQMHSDDQARKDQFESMRMLFLRLSVRQVDSTVPYGIQQKIGWPDRPFTKAVRMMCTFQTTPELPFPAELDHVVALYFVHRPQGWQYYCDPYLWWDHWSYDTSTPEEAWQSIMRAIWRRDVTGVYDMIDPQMLVDVDRAAFLRTTRDRLEQNDQRKAAEEAARKEARADRRQVPKLQPPPFLARDPHTSGSSKREVERSIEDGTEVARIWRLTPSGERATFETFVKRGERWYWKPKPEYTVWHDVPAATDPATQPAGPTTQPSSGSDSGE